MARRPEWLRVSEGDSGFYPREGRAMDVSEQRRDVVWIWTTLDAAWGRA